MKNSEKSKCCCYFGTFRNRSDGKNVVVVVHGGITAELSWEWGKRLFIFPCVVTDMIRWTNMILPNVRLEFHFVACGFLSSFSLESCLCKDKCSVHWEQITFILELFMSLMTIFSYLCICWFAFFTLSQSCRTLLVIWYIIHLCNMYMCWSKSIEFSGSRAKAQQTFFCAESRQIHFSDGSKSK